MSKSLERSVKAICAAFNNDRARMMDIVRAVQGEFGCVSGDAMSLIARTVNTHRVEVESVVSFYSYLSDRKKGHVVIRLCNDIIDRMHGAARIRRVFEDELGIKVGQTTEDGKITLEEAPCIGLCDQAPAALVNDVPVTRLSSDRARDIVAQLREHGDPYKLVTEFGDGNNAHDLVNSMVRNNLRTEVPLIFSPINPGAAIGKAVGMSPKEVIRAVKAARLRGRGGAGFPTGMKWEFCRAAEGRQRYVLCNADEGEPGTFKDRVILTERPDRVLAGMTIAGYAIGADTGIVYLRAEYAYLRVYLEHIIQQRREAGLLGKSVCGKEGFDFDIRIQMGAGAYVCGEETALISSCEGLRGDPKNRPPFPAQKGYLGCPTVVNNVETLCAVTKILENGPAAFCEFGSQGSTGTKLLSVSGDCRRPGVYELPFGVTVREVLKLAGGEDAIAVQVGGASGTMVAPDGFERKICFDDLATGGAFMVFGPQRNILDIVKHFMEFFIEESCGYCTPCRVGNVLLKERLVRILEGRGVPSDLDYLQELAETVKTMSRCGLGQTSPNPILTTLKSFRLVYNALVKDDDEGLQPSFDLGAAVADAEEITGRKSIHAH